MFAHLTVTDAAGLNRVMVARRVAIWHPLADKPWGMREFASVTPDGHRVAFGEAIAGVTADGGRCTVPA